MTEENLKKLNALRSLPKNSQVESRIAAIKDLLTKTEIFKTIQHLRWPEGVICPRCQSTKVIRREAPKTISDNDPNDKRNHYECLQCQARGDIHFFDDLTGLPIECPEEHLLGHLNNWILCWYLLGFCSITKIASILGLSLMQVMEMAKLGTHFSEVTKEKRQEVEQNFLLRNYKKQQQFDSQKKETVLKQERDASSESLKPLDLRPKSRK